MTADIAQGVNPLRDKDDRRLDRIAGPSALVIFGVTGDLSRKKLMPAVYDLANRGLLPPGFALVGFARRDWDDQDFAEVVHDAVKKGARTEFREETWEQLCRGIRFVQGEFDDPEAFLRLKDTVDQLDVERGTMGNHAFYLSIPPKSFEIVAQQLLTSGLVDDKPDDSRWRRVVIEKPFGHDLASARELNSALEAAFPADAIFRIDHYLGKETVQNILALRFANELYEPIWNGNYVDHVQITMA
ncbi:MAG: glucose-6-phosphate dehydrogenase, partial [Microbacterium sp.]